MIKNCALIIVIILALFFVNTTSALASPCELITPECTLGMFIDSVKNGNGNEIRGVVVPGLFASPVVQQPENQTGYVSDKANDITQHNIAEKYGVIGLLAHNEMEEEEFVGELFHSIEGGDIVILVMGDGRSKLYRVEEKVHYQKISPNDNWSMYKELANNNLFSTWQIFNKYYQTEDRYSPVVFQTCVQGHGISNWGLVFIRATPITFHYHISIQHH